MSSGRLTGFRSTAVGVTAPTVAVGAGAVIVAALEVLVGLGHELTAEIGYAALLLAIANVPANWSAEPDAVAALRVIGVIAVARVAAIATPLPDAPAAAHILVVAVAAVVAAAKVAPMVGLSMRRMLAARPAATDVHVILAGAGLGLLIYVLGGPQLAGRSSPAAEVVLALGAATAAAAVEEIVFRGMLQPKLQSVMGSTGILLACALFADMYLGFGSVWVLLAIALAGALFARSVALSGALRDVIAAHVMLAVGASVIWPLVLG
jgi:membrane protease YdiL (CAAX protease family)